MSNSSLAKNYPAHTNNYGYNETINGKTIHCTDGRLGNKITEITIHHMAGVMTAKGCGAIFQNPNRYGSSHYGIGNDGSIGQYVDEGNISWANSNWQSNCRAVTIEVSNSASGGQWKVSDAALKSLINLVADIAKRNKLGMLVPGKNLTWHRMYAATICPGDYLISKMQYIADEANTINSLVAKRFKAKNGITYWYMSNKAGYYTTKDKVTMWTNNRTDDRKKVVDIPKGAKVQSWGYYNVSKEGWIFHWVHYKKGLLTYKGYVANSYLSKVK